LKSLDIDVHNRKIIDKFSRELNRFSESLRRRDVKPIAIIAISIPNGMLKKKYINKFVSGKNYSKSARYHYENGIFEIIKERTKEEFPRVLFLSVNSNYLEELKKYFSKITVLDYQLKTL
jgi:hypothetical protein